MLDPRRALWRLIAVVCPLLAIVACHAQGHVWRYTQPDSKTWLVEELPAPKDQTPAVLAHRLGGNGNNLVQFGTYDVRTFGARCDGVTDDAAAFTAAIAAAKSVNGLVWIPPGPTACEVATGIVVNYPGARMECGAGSQLQSCIIQAKASIPYVIAWRTGVCPTCPGNGASPEGGGAPRGYLRDVTIDANHLAKVGLELNSSEMSSFDRVRVINGDFACIRNVNTQVAVSLSSITASVTGGSPTGQTVAQYDPNYSYVSLGTPITFVLKVSTTGALGTATYLLSTDGGSTFPGPALPLEAATNLMVGDGTNAQTLSGFVMTFPAGTYHANDTYRFTATWNTDSYNDRFSANGDNHYNDDFLYQCGTVHYTSGLASGNSGITGSQVSGTASTTANSQIITFTGAPDLTTFLGSGQSRVALKLNASTPVVYQGWIASSSTVVVVNGEQPTATASGLDFVIATGGGLYEDGLMEGAWASVNQMQIGASSVCMSFANNNGPKALSVNAINCGPAAVSVGGGATDATANASFGNWHNNSGTQISGSVPFLLSTYSSGTIDGPQSASGVAGNGRNWFFSSAGVAGCASPGSTGPNCQNMVPFALLSLVPTSQSISAASQQIQAPVQTPSQLPGNSSFVLLNVSGKYVMTSIPTITAAPAGSVLYLENVSPGSSITLQPNILSSSGIQLEGGYLTLNDGEIAKCISYNSFLGNWACTKLMSSYGRGNPNGNLGVSEPVSLTTTTAAATSIFSWDVGNSFVAPGTCAQVDIMAESQSGANVAHWRFEPCWTLNGTLVGSPLQDFAVKSTGATSLGWSVTWDPSGTTPIANVYVHGDTSGNAVQWTALIHHFDPGQ